MQNVVIAIEPGKVLAIKKDDGNVVVISVGAVTVSGGDVIIEDAGNLDTKDIFEVVKINTECDNTDMSVDTTDMDEELAFEGIVDSSELEAPNHADDEETGDNEDAEAMAFEGGGNKNFGCNPKSIRRCNVCCEWYFGLINYR